MRINFPKKGFFTVPGNKEAETASTNKLLLIQALLNSLLLVQD